MIGRFQFIAVLWLLILLGGMATVWVKWIPQGELQTILWWIAEIVLGVLAFQSLAALIMSGGMKKHFNDF